MADVEAEDFAAAVSGDPGRDDHRLGDDPVVDPGPAMGRVEKHVRVGRVGDGPVPERVHLDIQIGADPRSGSRIGLPGRPVVLPPIHSCCRFRWLVAGVPAVWIEDQRRPREPPVAAGVGVCLDGAQAGSWEQLRARDLSPKVVPR
jgi:hypothetical protein